MLEERSELEESLQGSVTYLSLDDCLYGQDTDFTPSADHPSPSFFEESLELSASRDSRTSGNSLLIVGTDSGAIYVIDALLNAVDHELMLDFNGSSQSITRKHGSNIVELLGFRCDSECQSERNGDVAVGSQCESDQANQHRTEALLANHEERQTQDCHWVRRLCQCPTDYLLPP